MEVKRLTAYCAVCLSALVTSNSYSTTGLFGDHIFADNGSEGKLSSNGIYTGSISAESGGKLILGRNSSSSSLNLDYKGGRAAAISVKDFGIIDVLAPEIFIKGSKDNSTGILLGKDGSLSLTALDMVLTGANSTGIRVDNSGILLNKASIDVTAIAFIAASDTGHSIINDSLIISRDLTAVEALNGSAVDINKSNLMGYVTLKALDGGSISMDGDNYLTSYSGLVMLSDGIESKINISGHVDINGNVAASNEGSVNLNLNQNSIFTGAAYNNSGVVKVSLDNSQWTLTDSSTITEVDLSQSILKLSNPDPSIIAQTLEVKGDFNSSDSNLVFGAVLGGDDSPSDKLIIHGNSSGYAGVIVNNLGGKGAEAKNGIELIQVDGKSDAIFTQRGRIVAGAYDYSLVRGSGINQKNWYLTTKGPEESVQVTESDSPDTPGKPDSPGKPDTPASTAMNVDRIRPEAAAYAVNSAAANTLFNTTLHDRLGESRYIENKGKAITTSMWLRNVGGHNRSSDSSSQNKTQANRYILQIGGDVVNWSTDGINRFDLGLMGGYANQRSNTYNKWTGYTAKSSIDGYSTGFYATWIQDDIDKHGAYIDSWLLYNWFDNTVNGEDSATERYKSKGLTASIETGYAWKLRELSQRNSWYIEPQGQLTYMDVESVGHREKNGTFVNTDGDGNLQSRLGVRTYLKGNNAIDDGLNRVFEPFVEINWIHNTTDFGASLDGVRIEQAGTRDIGEIKSGVEAKLNRSMHIWGNVSQRIGGDGYSDTQGVVGVRVNF